MALTATQKRRFKVRSPLAWWGWVLAALAALAANFAPPFFVVAGVMAVVVLVLLLKRPAWGAFALVLSVPVQKVVSYGPSEITVTQMLFVVVLGIWWGWMALRRDRRLVVTPLAVGLVFFLASTLPSLWVTTSLSESLAEISRWLVTILAYLIIVNSVQTRREMNILIAVMLIAGMSEAVLGLVQAYGGLGPSSFNAEGLLTRAYGTIGAPNSFAGYIDLSLPLALAISVYLWSKWVSARNAAPFLQRRTFWSLEKVRTPMLMSLVFITLFWTVVTSLSRGAWVGLSFGALAMVLALGKRASAAIAGLFGLIAAVLGLNAVGALPAVISDRFAQLTTQLAIFDPRGVTPTADNYAVVERMVHWQVAGNMFLSSPWIGVGFGNFNVLFNKFGVQGWPYSRGHAHNYYLHLLAEVGIVGLTFYLIMLITAVAVAVRALRRARARRDTYGEAVVIGALGILVTFMFHNLFENLHALNFGIHWGAALALFTLVWLRQAADSSRGAEDLPQASHGPTGIATEGN